MHRWSWGIALLPLPLATYFVRFLDATRRYLSSRARSLARRVRQNGTLTMVTIAILWTIFVIVSGTGWKLTAIPWDFTNTGALGDSFGVLSSGMAGVAAYFAFKTYKTASDEARLAERRAAEPSFLNLIERRFDMLDRVRFTKRVATAKQMTSVDRTGQSALDEKSLELWNAAARDCSTGAMATAYGELSSSVFGLTSFHRFTYHIIDYADRQFSSKKPGDEMDKQDAAYTYVRLLRAQMSDSELELIAMNCLYGSGKPKLKYFVERYALLNNLPDAEIAHYELPEYFADSAFGLEEKDRPDVVRNWSRAPDRPLSIETR